MTTAIRTRWTAVVGVSLVLFMATLDLTVVSVALPVIGHDLDASPQHAQWVMLAYFLPMVALAVPGGRWVDGAGLRAAYLLTALGFGASSALVGAAPAFWALVAARVVQGIFAGLIAPVIFAVVGAAVRPEQRGRALGLVAALAPIGAVLGPGLGGLLVDSVGWRAVFLGNVPTCLAAAWVGWRTVPGSNRLPAPGGRLLGEALVLGAGVAALFWTLDRLSGGGRDGLAVASAAVAVAAFATWRRLPASRRLMAVVLRRSLAQPIAALLFLVAGSNLLYFLMPYFLQEVAGHRAGVAGAVLLALPAGLGITSLLVNVVGGRAAERVGPWRLAVGGALLVLAGELLLLPLDAAAHPAEVAWRLALVGAGQGLFIAPNQTTILAAAPPGATATVGGVSALVRWLGFALGPATGALCWTLAGGGLPGVRAGLLAGAAAAAAAAAWCLVPGPRAMRSPGRPVHGRLPRRQEHADA